MYVSRLCFHTIPGKTGEAEKLLTKLQEMVAGAVGAKSRILHTHFASLGTPDIVFEQEIENLAGFEEQLHKLTDNKAFRAAVGLADVLPEGFGRIARRLVSVLKNQISPSRLH